MIHVPTNLMEIACLKHFFQLLKCAAYVKEKTSNYYVFSRQRYRLLGTMLLFQCCENYWQLYFAALKIIARSLMKQSKTINIL